MGIIHHVMAPIRSIARFPLFQLAVVVVLILWLQSADSQSVWGHVFNGLDALVDATVTAVASVFTVKSFTKSWLTSGFWIAYVYLACLLALALLRLLIGGAVDLAGRHNALWLRNTIARERGIAAYRAWVPLERIRPAIPQPVWEERFAWPADNKPPYHSLAQRAVRGILGYVVVIAAILILLQFTPCVATSFVPRNAARFQQPLGPGLEPRIETVHDEQSRLRDSARVGGGRLIELAIPIAADDRRQLHLVAGDAGDHVAQHAEGRNHVRPFRRPHRSHDKGQRAGDQGSASEAIMHHVNLGLSEVDRPVLHVDLVASRRLAGSSAETA